jgi:hypothetical protein
VLIEDHRAGFGIAAVAAARIKHSVETAALDPPLVITQPSPGWSSSSVSEYSFVSFLILPSAYPGSGGDTRELFRR